MGKVMQLKMERCLLIFLTFVADQAFARGEDFVSDGSLAEAKMNVFSFHVADFKGLMKDNLHKLQTDSSSQRLLTDALSSTGQTFHSVTQKFAKDLQRIPDDVEATFKLHLTHDNKAVAL